MALPMPIPPKPPWYSTPTAVPNCTSLIESPTDTPATEIRKNKSYDNIENKIKNNYNDRPDDEMIMMLLASPKSSHGIHFQSRLTRITPHKHLANPHQKEHLLTKQSASRGFENNRPDDDNDNNNGVDCSPRQDKQPVLQQQDILPTAPTAINTSPSLIESYTDKPTDPTNNDNNNNNIRRAKPARTKQSAYRTVIPKVPLLVWDGTQYQLDYNHNHRPISTWNGTTHTDIVYDDDYDCCTDYDYAYGDSLL